MKKYAGLIIVIIAFILIVAIHLSIKTGSDYRRKQDDARKQSLNQAFMDHPTSATLMSRVYDPSNGAFISGDPIRVKQ